MFENGPGTAVSSERRVAGRVARGVASVIASFVLVNGLAAQANADNRGVSEDNVGDPTPMATLVPTSKPKSESPEPSTPTKKPSVPPSSSVNTPPPSSYTPEPTPTPTRGENPLPKPTPKMTNWEDNQPPIRGREARPTGTPSVKTGVGGGSIDQVDGRVLAGFGGVLALTALGGLGLVALKNSKRREGE